MSFGEVTATAADACEAPSATPKASAVPAQIPTIRPEAGRVDRCFAPSSGWSAIALKGSRHYCDGHEHEAHPYRRRRPRRLGSRLAGGRGRRACHPARDAPGARHRSAQDRQPRRTRLLQFLPLRRCREQRGRPAACRNAACRLADHGVRRRQPGARRRRARRRPRRLFRRRHRQARSASADHHRARGGRRPAAGRLGPGDHRHRPADRAVARRGHRKGDRRRRAGVLRRHRADHPFRHDRHGHLLVPVALRQDRPRRHRQGLHQLPDGQGPVRGFRPGADRRAEDRIQGMGRHALFRRLPADRGDGRARPRDAAARPDEADGPHQRAQPDGQGLCGRAAPAGQCAGHALQHGRLPDQAEAWRAGAVSSA